MPYVSILDQIVENFFEEHHYPFPVIEVEGQLDGECSA